jgi:enamine deaminase RidA (YjgF/YER057c/UK114 family)
MNPDERLRELRLELPSAPQPMGVYRPVIVADGMAYLSGHGPLLNDGSLITGRVGVDLSADEGRAAARQTGLAMLASLQAALGSLDRVTQTVKLLGLVNCSADFVDQPAVINGCSELLIEVFGPERGVGARSAVGAVSLPANMAVEIEAIFRVNPSPVSH